MPEQGLPGDRGWAWDEAELREVLVSLAGVFDGEEPVDELDHALQCAGQAMAVGAGPEAVAAALLHDVARSPVLGVLLSGVPHQVAGARWLATRAPAKVSWLVEAHVPAKVWLVATEPAYRNGLSDESSHSLEQQQAIDLGPWVQHPWWGEALQLRRWDDAAKVPGASAPTIEEALRAARPQ